MKKTLIGGILAVFLSSQVSAATADYEKALTRHAQSSAREIIGKWIEQRNTGMTWNYILREKVPQSLDSQCGYRSLVGLSDIGFARARTETEEYVGERLERAFGPLLSRPNAQIYLASSKPMISEHADQAMVTLGVRPQRPNDATLTLILQLSGSGEMILCDLSSAPNPQKGILYQLGIDLNL